ncbi:hypothetical protein KKA00_09455 [bacterium]|nr:hypothetical protein [bacterium]
MSDYVTGVGNDAVEAKTGKIWSEWFTVLDAEGAKGLDHKGIVKILVDKYQLDGWWSQMVTVGYERERGLRELYEKSGGYEISCSKTLPVSVEQAFKAWQDDAVRKKWLSESIIVHKATPHKSMRVTWIDGQKSISVNFYPRRVDKCQISVLHGKLPDSKAVDEMKVFWGEALKRLGEYFSD